MMRMQIALWGLVAMMLVACNSSPPATTGPCLPADVSLVLESTCQSCHGARPIYGAPMPLVTYADTQASVVDDQASNGTRVPAWQLIQRRIHDTTNPMPPTGVLPADQLATLDSWLQASAPAGMCGGADASVSSDAAMSDAGAVGPAALPCPASEQTTYLAHGSTTGSGFTVPSDAANLYECFTWRSPFAAPTQATAFAPIVGDARVLHHYILYETATAQVDGGFGPCHMPADAVFVSGWAPGGVNNVLPSDVGLDLPGTDHWFILQVHYHNIAGYTDAVDGSGLAMCTTTNEREHHAAVHMLGTLNIAIPPHITDYTTTGTCTPTTTVPIHVLAATPHMHLLGASFQTMVLPGGDATRAQPLVQVPHWDFENQHPYTPADTLLMPGDVLQTTCHYFNNGDTTVYFGENTENEMCFDFVLAWPAGSLVNAGGASSNRCIDRGT